MAVREALDTLKDRLKELDDNLVENTDGFDGQAGEVSMQGSVIGEKFTLTPKNKNYSQQSLQATFNIANIASRSLGLKGVLGLFAGNGKILKHNFDYLDENWVPKIVDETTYKTGIALKEFLVL